MKSAALIFARLGVGKMEIESQFRSCSHYHLVEEDWCALSWLAGT